MPKEKQPEKEQIKVTDKRIFTPEGEIREEFREDIKPAAPSAAPPAAAPSEPPAEPSRRMSDQVGQPGERRKTLADKAANPGTPFSNFLEPLIAQAYMSMGMLPNPYQPEGSRIDVAAARQMIDILNLLHDKTAGNLSPEEDDFLNTHLGELKLAFVKRTKSVG
ncbi:MAG TPA: DUF1844 domain-containing protein [Thermoanaerobaculia bacterium]|nr:DUF1844 domain-containing protein [Thermoanaerobaculia bacterium]